MLTSLPPLFCRGEVAPGQAIITQAGAFLWRVPAGVHSVSLVLIGAGANGSANAGGGAAGLLYANDVPVTPGQDVAGSIGAPGAIGGDTRFGSIVARGANGKIGGGFDLPAGIQGLGHLGGDGGDYFSGYGGGGGAAGRYGSDGGKGAPYVATTTYADVWIPPNKSWTLTANNGSTAWSASPEPSQGVTIFGSTSTAQPLGSTYRELGIISSGPYSDGRYFNEYIDRTYTLQGTEGHYESQPSTSYSSGNPTGIAGQGRGGVAGQPGEGALLDGTDLAGPYGRGGARNGPGSGGALRLIWPGRTRRYPATRAGDL